MGTRSLKGQNQPQLPTPEGAVSTPLWRASPPDQASCSGLVQSPHPLKGTFLRACPVPAVTVPPTH